LGQTWHETKKLEKWGTFVAWVTHDLSENFRWKILSHIHYNMASLPYKIHEWFSMFSLRKNLTKFVRKLQISCNA